MRSSETIFAHSSGRPPAAIAVIRISGPQAHAAARQLAGTLPPPRAATLRRLRDADGMTLDEALLLRFDAPHSATGEHVMELHCHGGRAVVNAVLNALQTVPGLRKADPGEFTRRAFENGRIDLTEAEGLADLLEAETEGQRKAALALAGGALRRQVENWRDRLVTLSAQAEAAIDYAGDEDETAVDAAALADAAGALAADLNVYLAQPRRELLKAGIRVVVAGPPNAGKSSLVNALAGDERAIVTAVPGTTRDLIEVPIALAGTPFILVDTAGLRDSKDEVERVGIGLARQQLQLADLLLWLGASEHAPSHPHRLLVHSRCDLPDRHAAPSSSLPVSTVSGTGMRALVEWLLSQASDLLPGENVVSLNRRHERALSEAADALAAANQLDVVLTADALRQALHALDRVTGRAGVEDVLDVLFGRFCLGK